MIGFGVLFFGRLPHEEQLMLKSFGDDYRKYMERTYRLVPGIYKRADLPAGYIRLDLAISSFSRPCEGPATFCGGLLRLNFRDDPGHELRGYFGMRFGCEVDMVEAVIVRKNGIEDDNRDPTAPQMICYLSDVVGPSFRGHKKRRSFAPGWRITRSVRSGTAKSGVREC